MGWKPTALPEVLVYEPAVFGDDRGFFMEVFRGRWFEELGLDSSFVQDNFSRSAQGVLRGLHYQVVEPQGKFVRAVHGEIFDVAVDLRRSSPNFGKWVGVTLSAENKHALWIPPGFGHGFYTVSEFAEVMYKCTAYYAPQYDRNVRWDDPTIGIDWPLNAQVQVQLSGKDQQAPLLYDADLFD
jgi:dTDP-4-dehydrorhamnose 3,5-epimerase